jgi:hypothetical protein
MKSCIATLTRGYTNIDDYSNLIKRNKHIEIHLTDKTIDILIFHEGNITDIHQKYILNATPNLNIKFINISGKAFKNEKATIQFDKDTINFGLGYRHMCSFWFIDFWHFITDYDYLVRIDEDCFINSSIDNIFKQLNDHIFVAGMYRIDKPFVTKGLNNFTLSFIKSVQHKLPTENKCERAECIFTKHTNIKNNNGTHCCYACKTANTHGPVCSNTIYYSKLSGGPYTNCIGINLNKVKENTLFQKYKASIESSNKIYEMRWGDLPIWGEAIYYIFGESTLFIDKTIQYFHESHNKQVN